MLMPCLGLRSIGNLLNANAICSDSSDIQNIVIAAVSNEISEKHDTGEFLRILNIEITVDQLRSMIIEDHKSLMKVGPQI